MKSSYPTKLKLVRVTDPEADTILGKPSENVTVFDSELKQFCRNMLRVMRANYGMGLASPQVNVHKRIVVLGYHQRDEHILINPVIVNHSKETRRSEEGCLSIPNKKIERERYLTVEVEYQDLRGNRKILHLSDKNGTAWAQCIQHEIDHLNGILMTTENNL
jgi:peptide deformylase